MRPATWIGRCACSGANTVALPSREMYRPRSLVVPCGHFPIGAPSGSTFAPRAPLRWRLEEEQGARAAPDDLLTSYPGLGARAPCSAASAPARALARSAHRPWPSTDFGIAASGPRIGAWMVCPPARRGIRTTAPGSCAEGRFQDRRRLISEASADNHISQRSSCSVSIHSEPQKLIPAAAAWPGVARDLAGGSIWRLLRATSLHTPPPPVEGEPSTERGGGWNATGLDGRPQRSPHTPSAG